MKYVLFMVVFFTSLAWAGKPVNINEADAELISASLDGIGIMKAKKIVEHREQSKVSFTSLDDVAKIKGIGSKVLEDNAAFIRF